jgi:cytochrome c553
MSRRTIIAIAALIFAVGCGDSGDVESENYGNLLDSPAGLIVVREEHPTGWTRPDCFACHEVRNMHTVNRTGIPDLDLNEVQAIVSELGQASCVQCHGDNGVQ